MNLLTVTYADGRTDEIAASELRLTANPYAAIALIAHAASGALLDVAALAAEEAEAIQ